MNRYGSISGLHGGTQEQGTPSPAEGLSSEIGRLIGVYERSLDLAASEKTGVSMPPGPAFNVVCVASAFANIISHAARIRAAQMAAHGASGTVAPKPIKHAMERVPEGTVWRHGDISGELQAVGSEHLRPPYKKNATSSVDREYDSARKAIPEAGALPAGPTTTPLYDSEGIVPTVDAPEGTYECPIVVSEIGHPAASRESSGLTDREEEFRARDQPSVVNHTALTEEGHQADPIPHVNDRPTNEPQAAPTRTLRASRVPSSRIGRLFHYGGLAASLGYGAASELIQRSTGLSSQSSSPVLMTEANVHRLVSKLLKMRGAALKLGQFMSIQDTHVLPPAVDKIFRMVQDSAHYMPDSQMEQVLSSSLGSDWMAYFKSFDRVPFAAASIGQVHKAVLSAAHSPTGRPENVAVKIQFPNIVDSIESDLGYIRMLLTAGSLLPKGLFLDRTIQVMKDELKDECDYIREASFLRKFASLEFLGDDPRFKVPWVWDGSTDQVLVMEHVEGVNIGEITHEHVAQKLSQNDRNDIASSILQLCLRELFDFRLMQTDPNWTNFLWNPRTRQIELVDFGATREYSKEFMDSWLHLLQAAIAEDKNSCIEWSIKLGYLTGEETDVMLDAHVKSMALLATPFRPSTTQPFAFGPGSEWTEITANIRAGIPVMLKHRLTPPPRETYSLNRKLSGSFLLAARLGAQFDTRALWDDVVSKYKFSS